MLNNYNYNMLKHDRLRYLGITIYLLSKTLNLEN